MAALAYRDTTQENREYWKNEMGQAMREIQQVYEDKLETMRNEIEASYSLKVTSHTLSSSCYTIFRILYKSCFLSKYVKIFYVL